MQDSHLRPKATWVLTLIGPAAVPALTEALAHRTWQVRAAAADALGEIGPAAAAAVPALTAALKDKSREVREAAAQSLADVQDEK